MMDVAALLAVLSQDPQEPQVQILPVDAQAAAELQKLTLGGKATGMKVSKDPREQDWMLELHEARHNINLLRARRVNDELVAVELYVAVETAKREGRNPNTDPIVRQIIEFNPAAFNDVRAERAKEVEKSLRRWLARDESDDSEDDVKLAVNKVVSLWCQLSNCRDLQELEEGLKLTRGNNTRQGFKSVVRNYFAREFEVVLSDGFFVDPSESMFRNDNHGFYYHVAPTFRLLRLP